VTSGGALKIPILFCPPAEVYHWSLSSCILMHFPHFCQFYFLLSCLISSQLKPPLFSFLRFSRVLALLVLVAVVVVVLLILLLLLLLLPVSNYCSISTIPGHGRRLHVTCPVKDHQESEFCSDFITLSARLVGDERSVLGTAGSHGARAVCHFQEHNDATNDGQNVD
jgi:hypothetical protein